MGSQLLARLLRPFTPSVRSHVTDASSNGGANLGTNGLPLGVDPNNICTIAAGCFWGPEHMYRHHFKGKGLVDAKVGYIGGTSEHPTYRGVCSGKTGHAEAAQIQFDPEKVTYRELLEFFYRMHDPTQKDRQGPDVGTQYRSAIFVHTPEQKAIAQDVTAKVQQEWYTSGKVVTDVVDAEKWWDAETYHQNYLNANPGGYECPSHYLRKFPALSETTLKA